jgi:hypothetical protein
MHLAKFQRKWDIFKSIYKKKTKRYKRGVSKNRKEQICPVFANVFRNNCRIRNFRTSCTRKVAKMSKFRIIAILGKDIFHYNPVRGPSYISSLYLDIYKPLVHHLYLYLLLSSFSIYVCGVQYCLYFLWGLGQKPIGKSTRASSTPPPPLPPHRRTHRETEMWLTLYVIVVWPTYELFYILLKGSSG